MSYKTILVSLNEVSQLRGLLSVTAGVARADDAHVIGLYVIPAVELRLSNSVEEAIVEVPLRDLSHPAPFYRTGLEFAQGGGDWH